MIKIDDLELGRLFWTRTNHESFKAENLSQLRTESREMGQRKKNQRDAMLVLLELEEGGQESKYAGTSRVEQAREHILLQEEM